MFVLYFQGTYIKGLGHFGGRYSGETWFWHFLDPCTTGRVVQPAPTTALHRHMYKRCAGGARRCGHDPTCVAQVPVVGY